MNWRRGIVVATVALTCGVVAARAQAPSRGAGAAAPRPEQQLITMDFQDVEITVLAKFISEITGRNFIIDEKIRGKVTVISPTKITVDEAYRVFQSILEVKGFTTVPSGPAIKIVATKDAKESGAPLSTPKSRGAEYVTQLVPLAYVDPESLMSVLQPMVSKDGLISSYEPTNTLILIDTASNIDRLMEIVAELDIEVPDRGIEIIRLENAFATELAETLEQALEADAARGAKKATGAAARKPAGAAQAGAAVTTPGEREPFKVIPDERTNSLIVMAGPTKMRSIKNLVRELDRTLEGVAKINVYRLRYANADEMVDVLGQLIGGGGGGGGGGGLGGASGLGRSGTSSRRNTRQSLGRTGGRSGSSTRGLGNQLGNQGGLGGGAQQRTAAAVQAASATGSGGGEFIGEVNVTADPYTNSLVISAGRQDYEVLKRVISELDVPRRQVLVEAIILEVSLDKTKALGIELQGATALGKDALGLGRVNLESLNAAVTQPGSISGLLAAAASNQTITLPDGTKVPAQVALLTALQNDDDVNVLSAPTILTSDNQEAEIVVAQNIPFIASRAADISNLQNQFTTVERQDVGITLQITPQISDGNVVRLDIYEEVSAVVPNPPVDPNLAGPTTTVRSASTTVVAADSSTVVIGGLIADSIINQESKVPYLGDIPVLGNLFKSSQDTSNKVNLLIFLTPRIIRDNSELQRASLDERRKLTSNVGRALAPSSRRALARPTWENSPLASNAPAWSVTTTETQSRYDVPAPVYAPPAEPMQQRYEVPPPSYVPPVVSSLPPSSAPPPSSIAPSMPASSLGLPSSGHKYVVLLSYLEQGTSPPGLETQSGFLTVYVPAAAGEFFVKGGAYEYVAPGYEAKFTVLEVFPGPEAAMAVYPEGQRVEQWNGAVVRWKPIGSEQMQQIVAGKSPWKRIR